MAAICMTCRWWDTSVSADDGELSPCRLNPPVVQDNVKRGVWPMTEADDWCARHESIARPVVDAPVATWPIELTPEEEKTAKLWKSRRHRERRARRLHHLRAVRERLRMHPILKGPTMTQFVAVKFRVGDSRPTPMRGMAEPLHDGDTVRVEDRSGDGWKKVFVVSTTDEAPPFQCKADPWSARRGRE
jgi:hypothetical protein